MLEGKKFPGLFEGNHAHYDNCASTQLQLLGHVPSQYTGGVGIVNNVRNEHEPTDSRPMKRIREEEPVYMQHKLGLSPNNNLYQGKHAHTGTLLNPNHVSPGLRLSCKKQDPSTSIISTSENLKKGIPFFLSLGETVKMEMDRQMEELAQYIKLQEEIMLKGGKELNERHSISLLNALEKGANRKLQEKELEIENLNLKNKELEEKIKQVSMEAQSWHYRAKYNESVANALKSNIQQLMAQGPARCHEGFGDSEVDDGLSCMKHPRNQELDNHRLKCRFCKDKSASVLLFPCRHLCLCADCEGFVDVCPVCQVMKTDSFAVMVKM